MWRMPWSTTDFSVIENDPEVELVVESIGGIHPAYEYIKKLSGKGQACGKL